MKRCTKCILPADFPSIKFNSDGVCNYCVDWEIKWENYDYKESEAKLVAIFDEIKKKKRKYDCLIPYSGGRDSSYVVYLCKIKYGLNPLLVTFNNLFMSEYAINNINNMVDILNVEHRFITYKPKQLKEFYRSAVRYGGEFCSICSAGINYAKYHYQKIYNIPLVITGTCSRVDEQSPFEINCSHPLYVRRLLSKAGFASKDIEDFVITRHFEWGMKEKVRRKMVDNDYVEIALPDYIHWDNKRINKSLQENLGWNTPDEEMDHIDCKYAPVKTYMKNKQMPSFIFKQEKFSQLIRDGQMTRKDALDNLQKLIEEDDKPKEYDDFVRDLGLSNEIMRSIGCVSHLDIIAKDEIHIKKSIPYHIVSIIWKDLKFIRKKIKVWCSSHLSL